jgi:molecular chaperone GrpE
MKNPFKNLFNMSEQETATIIDEMFENGENVVENAPEMSEITENTAKIAELETQVADLKDKFLRQAAEFQNYKTRAARESLEVRQTAGREILSVMIPILDDFDRAALHGTFSEGVHLIYQKLQTTLSQRGLRAMESTGELFNPDLHEAIADVPAISDEMRGKVIDTTEKGYFLNDKLIRFAQVVVGK